MGGDRWYKGGACQSMQVPACEWEPIFGHVRSRARHPTPNSQPPHHRRCHRPHLDNNSDPYQPLKTTYWQGIASSRHAHFGATYVRRHEDAPGAAVMLEQPGGGALGALADVRRRAMRGAGAAGKAVAAKVWA